MKILTIPNIITVSRLILVPWFCYEFIEGNLTKAVIIFFVASTTDWLDGVVARRFGMQSELGAFLDPLVDKVLVLSALFIFVFIDWLNVSIVAVILIVLRDILITLLRIFAIKKGVVFQTSILAKAKTGFQMTTVVIIMIYIIVLEMFVFKNNTPASSTYVLEQLTIHFGKFGKIAFYTPSFLVYTTSVITVISGLDYCWKYRKFVKNLFKEERD